MRLTDSELAQLREMFSPDGRELRLVLPLADATDQLLDAMQKNDDLMQQAQNFGQAQQQADNFADAAGAGDAGDGDGGGDGGGGELRS
jgi:hypothetical protein